MKAQISKADVRLDVAGLLLAGLINTFLALADAVLILGPGTAPQQPELMSRVLWIADHSLRWRVGWSFWFAVTLSFAWSYYALGRHLSPAPPWRSLAVGVALIAAAVDLIGVVVNITVLPALAQQFSGSLAASSPSLLVMFESMEGLATALINVVAFGLYSLAGLLLLPALFSTVEYPRWLAWLGMAEWVIASLATVLLIISPREATIPLLISFLLYAPWVWASAWWLRREK